MGEQQDEFSKQIGKQAARKQHARQTKDRSLWHGLGAIGTVGWTVGLPTLIGVLLGAWIDATWPASPLPWTPVLLVAGLSLGVVSAWLWMEEERKEMRREGWQQNMDEENDS